MEPAKRETMLSSIRVIDLVVDQIEGQAKLNQHKSDGGSLASPTSWRAPRHGHRRLAEKMRALRPGLAYEVAEKCAGRVGEA